ncbi:MAG: response regulator, partial [Planctomycetales bacterium]|nr:response regulator [Planctomycetales bacterium]
MKHGSLLLIDDDRGVRESMASWLREQGHQVETAVGRADGLRKVDAQAFDLVLSDIRLEDGDGFDVLAHCRAKHPDTTVILMTGYGTMETGVEALRAGAFD